MVEVYRVRFRSRSVRKELAALAHAQAKQGEAATDLRHAHRLFTSSRVPKYVERTEQLAKTFGVALSGELPDDLPAA